MNKIEIQNTEHKQRLFVISAMHNRKIVTTHFCNLLQSQSVPFELIIVDDGSTDGSSAEVLKLIPNATILIGNGNLWWSGSLNVARNYLINKANASDNVLIINDDSEFDCNFLERGINILNPTTIFMVL